MSSPRNKSNGSTEIREGTRVVLKEITASLHNSPVKQASPNKSGNDTALSKSPEHAVKVQFAREFADVKTAPASVVESLSSASSFQSLSSTLSSKSSSGICADSAPGSPSKSANSSYINSDIPGLDDIIAACADIKLSEQGEQVLPQLGTGDLSQDQSFASAVGDLSIVEEDPEEEEDPKEKSKLNETFEVDCSASNLPENPSSKSECLSVQDSSSVIPYASFEDSILKTQSLHSINKDSTVFATANDFQTLEGFDLKNISVDYSNADINKSQNESIAQSNSSNVEFPFDASIDSLKNVSVNLISVNESVNTPLERTQTPTTPLLPSISNVSTEDSRDASPNFESKPQEQILENHVLDSSVPISSKESLTEDNFNPSNQETAIEPEIIPLVSPQIPKEDIKVTQEIPDVLKKSVVDSSFSIIPQEVQPQVLEKDIEATEIVKNIFQDSNQGPVPEKIESPLNSPRLQSILEKVAEQQKSLDSICAVDEEENKSEVEKTDLCNSFEKGKVPDRHLVPSPVIETSPNSQSSLSSPLLYESSPQQDVLNSTVVISSETHPKTPELAPSVQEILNTPENLSEDKTLTITPSPDILFLQQKTLDSTVISSNETKGQEIPDIKISSPENSLKKKEVEETKPVEENKSSSEIPQTETPKRSTEKRKIIEVIELGEDIESTVSSEVKIKVEKTKNSAELDSTIILEDSEIDLEAPDFPTECPNLTPEKSHETDVEALNSNPSGIRLTPGKKYENFKPQQQSTDITSFGDPFIFDKVELEAQAIAKEIYDKSLEFVDENEQFTSATSELFQDPAGFDFLLSQGSTNNRGRDLRFESLYVKFDPLVNRSMLPQGNSQTEDEEQNGKNETPSVPSVDTPMRNPAIAAIDRLLFYSPISTGLKNEATKDIKQEVAETAPQESVPIIDEKMAKELELVRSSLMQLQEKLEKSERDREEDTKKHMKELKKKDDENSKSQEKVNRLEAQLAQEIESKKQVTVILDEYEKSISRLVAERERDRVDLEEKSRMKEELQAASQHLSNTEAAFNDVHQKYERLKGVVAVYKSNETVLKESVQENVETIKALENRYEQLKSHAMAQLEKANHELETIRKQNEAETVKLQAMLKKTELKCKSLADLVEQKTKENKELTQILDEVIARVGNQNSD